MTTTESVRDAIGGATTYMASALGYLCSQMADVNWMQVGAIVLLVSRLISDVPRAYAVLKQWKNKWQKTK